MTSAFIESKRTLVLLYLVFLIPLSGNTQIDYTPGYIIKNEGDSVFGLIQEKNNYKVCRFRASGSELDQEFLPGTIQAYRFTEGKYFVSKTIEEEEGPRLLFVEYLVNGKVNLYYYNNFYGKHYLIEKEDGSLLELSNSEEYIRTNEQGEFKRNSNEHVGLLAYYFSDCMEIQPELAKVSISHNSLVNISKKYHEYVCEDEVCIIYEKQIPALKVGIAPYVGYSFSSLRIKDEPLLEKFSFQNSNRAFVGLNFSFYFPRINKNLALQIDANYGELYSTSFRTFYYGYTEKHNSLEIDFSYLKAQFVFNYTWPTGRLRPSLGLGCGLMHAMNVTADRFIVVEKDGEETGTEFYSLNFEKDYFNLIGMAGVQYHINRRQFVFFKLSYESAFGISTDFSTYINTLGLRLGYSF